jgi:hypothetical protein
MNTHVSTAFAWEMQFAPLAQLAEQLTLNQRVAGSIPARCTFSRSCSCSKTATP